MAETLSPDERLALEQHEFFEWIQLGTPEIHAAVAVGWSVAKLRRLSRDPDFAEMLALSHQHANGTIEQVVYDKARAGGEWAVKMWLHNRAPERWVERKEVNVHASGAIAVGVIEGTKEGIKAMLADSATRADAIRALAPGGPLDEIEDAEVIEDDGA